MTTIQWQPQINALTKPQSYRIQVIPRSTGLDMKEGGAAGAEVPVTAEGDYTLPDFSGSAVSSLTVAVNDYAALMALVLNSYSGRLADILDVLPAA